MTIAPQQPILTPIAGKGNLRTLVEDHLTFVKVGFGYSLEVLIKAGYETDGATIPDNLLQDEKYGKKIEEYIRTKYPSIKTKYEYDLENLVKYLIGTPWDMPRLLAAIVHDVLYGRKWKIRWLCDKVYRLILLENNYDVIRAEIEYGGIRLIGWKNWESVSDSERKQTKRLSEVKIIKTKNKEKEILHILERTSK